MALDLACLVVGGCAAAPAGPRPTLPHPSYAPVVVPANDEAGGRKQTRPGITSRPGALTDAEWRTAFCKTQDAVFGLEFAVRWATDVAGTRDLEAFRRAVRVLAARVGRARTVLLSVPARYARPLVNAELVFLRAMDRLDARILELPRNPSPSRYPAVRAAGRAVDRGWKQMVRVNDRLQEGEYRLVCL